MNQIKVLIIDSDQQDALSIFSKERLALNKEYSICFESSLKSGVEKFKESYFDVVIVKFDTLEYRTFITELKKIDPDACIIVYIGKDDPETIEGLTNAGVYECIIQPLNSEKLSFLLRKGAGLHSILLANRKLLQSLHEHNAALQKQNLLLVNRVEDLTKNLVRLYEDLRTTYMRTIKTLAQVIDAKDHYTHSHSQSVAKYAVAIAEEMHLSAKDVELIREACELHDLGKIGIQDSILSKSSALSPEEWKEIKKHPITGAQILEPLTFLSGVTDIIRQHHENFDGSGYTQGLSGDNILLGARIIHLVDAYEAMRSARSYRKVPLTKHEAILEIKNNSGTQFDPGIVKAFLKIVDDLDPG